MYVQDVVVGTLTEIVGLGSSSQKGGIVGAPVGSIGTSVGSRVVASSGGQGTSMISNDGANGMDSGVDRVPPGVDVTS